MRGLTPSAQRISVTGYRFLRLSVIKLHMIYLELSNEASEDVEIDSIGFRNPSKLLSGCCSLCSASCTYLLLPSCGPQAPFFASIPCLFFSSPSSLDFSASCPEGPMRQILPPRLFFFRVSTRRQFCHSAFLVGRNYPMPTQEQGVRSGQGIQPRSQANF